VRELIKKYSNYVAVPIMMQAQPSSQPSPLEEKEQATKWEDAASLSSEGERIQEWGGWVNFEQVNETKPIWKKSKTSISGEEYKEFYQSVSMDFNAPLGHIHSSIEW